MPKRIQRKRTKGWKMPPNTVYVGRPTRWGNPFAFDKSSVLGVVDFKDILEKYRNHIENVTDSFEGLRGKDLACWCKEGAPCHADILLELANPIICSACQRGDYCPHGRPASALSGDNDLTQEGFLSSST